MPLLHSYLQTLGTDLHIFIPLFILIGGLIIFGKDVKLGAVILFFTQGIAFLICYLLKLDYSFALKLLLLSFLLLVLTIIITKENQQTFY